MILLSMLIASVATAAPAPAKAPEQKVLRPADDDPVLRALHDELERARTLKMSAAERPYYLAAFANDEESFHVAASFGALLGRGRDRRQQLNTHVRVGSEKLDNTNFAGGDFGFGGGPSPAERDYDAVRQALWLRFDEAFKGALESIAKKRAFLETSQVKERPADFAPAPVVSLVLPRESLSVDEERWTKLVRRASAVFRAHPEVHACQVAMRASVSHQSMVSSDPSRHRFPERHAQLTIQASTQAKDGMELSASYLADGRTEADLPSDAEVVKAAERVASRLKALAKAPVASEDYTGPVLFVGRAAGVFFLQALGEPLSRPRDDLGDARQGRLVDRLGKHIATKLLTARDDPTQVEWGGRPLLGHFAIDDDGVKPKPITLVERGVLKTFYMSRVPTKRVQESNGHSRAGQGAVGNLFIETSEPTPRAALKKKLVELALEEDLEYGLMVEELEESRLGAGTNHISLPPLRVVWRVYPDGREVLERGAGFKPANFRALKDIVGMGDDPSAVNLSHRGQKVSVVAPSVLVKLLELQRLREEFEKPPFTPRPPLAGR